MKLGRAEYRLGEDRSVSLFIDGQETQRVGEVSAISPLRSRARADAVMELLQAAMVEGAEDGPYDSTAAMAASLNRGPVPLLPTWRTLSAGGSASVVRVGLDGGPDTVVLAGIRPQYLAGDIMVELQRAYRVGGTYGAPGTAFYVTIIRSRSERGRLLGPYATLPEAEAQVERARTAAERIDSWSGFDGFGVARFTAKPGTEFPPGRLNDHIGLTAGEESAEPAEPALAAQSADRAPAGERE